MRLDAFSDSGYFWLPGGEDQSLQVPGNLSVSEAGRVTLETFGYWSKDPLSLAHDNQPSKLTRIFGYTPEWGNVTLTGAVATRDRIQSRTDGWVFNCTSFVADRLLTGGHFSEKDPLFDRLGCKIEVLHEWIGVPGFTIERESHLCTSITYQRPAPLPFQVSDDVVGEFGLEHSISFQAPAGIKVPKARYNAYIKLSTSTSWTTEEVLRWVFCMRNFVSLGTGTPVAITSLAGWKRTDGHEDENTDDREEMVEIFCESQQHSPKPIAKLLPQFMNFTYRDLSDVSYSIQKWIDLCLCGRSKGGQAIKLFFDSLYGDGILPVDLRFIKVEESLQKLAPVMGVVTKERETEKRIMLLASRFSELLGIEAGCEMEFAKRVRATRNLWVHRDPRPEAQACEGVDLLRLLDQCEALLFCCLTAHVLGSEEEAIRVLRDARPIKDRVRLA